MNKCDQITAGFGDLHDGEIEGALGESMRRHLDDCVTCREDYKWYGITVQALNNLDTVTPPSDFLEKLQSRLDYESPYSRVRYFFKNLLSTAPYMPLPAGVTALTVIIAVGLLLYNQSPVDSTSVVGLSGSNSLSTGLDMARNVNTVRVASSNPTPLTAKSLNISNDAYSENILLPTIAEKIGADNLTVESSSVDHAVESLKQILPNIQGMVVDEKQRTLIGEKIVTVLIPSDAYGNLTSELVNHGAVAVGLGSGAAASEPTKKDGNNVLLYIRFVNMQ